VNQTDGESALRVCMTGDLVGTLRYMSPEQALAKRVLVDHRTDVYSLGVTLYEMLTLEPAYSGSDREEILRQIVFQEPRAPRQRNKAIPRELETIVLKAIEKGPEARYGSAQEHPGRGRDAPGTNAPVAHLPAESNPAWPIPSVNANLV